MLRRAKRQARRACSKGELLGIIRDYTGREVERLHSTQTRSFTTAYIHGGF